MESAAIGELKARLSAYLARVRAGEEVVVTDRGRPVARLVPPRTSSSTGDEELEELARAGVVRIGSDALPAGFWTRERPRDPSGSVREAMLEERRSGR
jgi:prevent-host-death family protein